MKTIILGLGIVFCILTFTGCRKQGSELIGTWKNVEYVNRENIEGNRTISLTFLENGVLNYTSTYENSNYTNYWDLDYDYNRDFITVYHSEEDAADYLYKIKGNTLLFWGAEWKKQ